MTSSRPDPLSRVVALAFAGRLREASVALDRVSDRGDPLEVRWLRSSINAARGDFVHAERGARSVLRDTADPSLRARAAVTLGSVLRQTDRHRAAREIESAALPSTRDPLLRAHLHVGLAADAVGLGELRAVDRAIDRAHRTRLRDPRLTIRLRWVRCERELLAGRPGAAARWARAAAEASRRAGARRHLAKSLLFLGVAQLELARRAGGSAADARASLSEARATASRIGAEPIARVARELLRDAGRGR